MRDYGVDEEYSKCSIIIRLYTKGIGDHKLTNAAELLNCNKIVDQKKYFHNGFFLVRYASLHRRR